MKTKQIVIIGVMVDFCIICLVIAFLFMVISKDLGKKVEIYERNGCRLGDSNE